MERHGAPLGPGLHLFGRRFLDRARVRKQRVFGRKTSAAALFWSPFSKISRTAPSLGRLVRRLPVNSGEISPQCACFRGLPCVELSKIAAVHALRRERLRPGDHSGSSGPISSWCFSIAGAFTPGTKAGITVPFSFGPFIGAGARAGSETRAARLRVRAERRGLPPPFGRKQGDVERVGFPRKGAKPQRRREGVGKALGTAGPARSAFPAFSPFAFLCASAASHLCAKTEPLDPDYSRRVTRSREVLVGLRKPRNSAIVG